MNEEKSSNRLYLRFSFLILLFFFIVLLIVAIILGLILLSPFSNLLIRGFVSTTIITLVSIYLASAIVSSFMSYFFGKKILKPIAELSNKSMKVARGDFSVKLEEKSFIPAIEQTLKNFNVMVEELSKVETLSNDFISNVSHEFKTPLSVIRSNVNILQNTELNEEERKKCLNAINQSTEKLSTLVSNVLKISKLDNQNIKLEKKAFRLDEQLRKCILNFSDKLEEKNIELDIDLEDCILNSDEDLLNQVWINLLSNAIKFSHQNGTIKVSLRTQKNIEVTIEDNGEGMSEETKKHIFDRFYQGETSHSKEGNGLGLTIVCKILKVCNASIQVHSVLGKGTAFVVEFKKNN